ncbi:MAG: thioesterase family protein [Actinomycetota bacterium]|nr:thioesterase family protein [Actinomycetota bacterium]
MPDSFFVKQDEASFSPTDRTIGPWSRDAQHGGPPAALLGRCIEREAGPGKQIVRISFDILKPVPVGPLTVETSTIRPGRKVSLHEATLTSDGIAVMRAVAWAIRLTEVGLPAPEAEPPPPPQNYEPMDFSTIVPPPNYLHATEWRFVSGAFLEQGPAIAWLRTLVPLVEGEEDSALTKVLAVTDSASGISGALDFFKWLYINVDLSVYLHRMPEGPWIRIDAVTTPEPTGNGLTSARLSDQKGPIGTSSQALFLQPR